MSVYHADHEFVDAKPDVLGVSGAEFERCAFKACAWPAADLKKARFTDCVFEGCDLSNVKVASTSFRTVSFIDCKLLGIQFDGCNAFLLSLAFKKCRLDYASFRGLDLKGTGFDGCLLRETDFSGTDLSGASFDESELSGAMFDGTGLEGADLRSANGFIIDPEKNRLKGARFGLHGLPGLLMKYGLQVEE